MNKITNPTNAIILLSCDLLLRKSFKNHADKYNTELVLCSNTNQLEQLLNKENYKHVIVSFPLEIEPYDESIITLIHSIDPDIKITLLLDRIDVSTAIYLTKLGADNCYAKPYVLDSIFESILSIKHDKIQAINTSNTSAKSQKQSIEPKSQAAQDLYRKIDQVKDTNFKVIIYGETGSGKESVARRLSNGIYKDKPFIAVDCGCLNKELASSELFGHKKGSFSGAFEDKIGAFEEANHGTLFLDEIGNLDYAVQTLLLRAIEERKIKKIGSNKEIDVNVRILVASNEKLSDAVEKGTFRQDLYHRLNEFEINVPPLRERLDDLEHFINFFIEQTNKDLKKNIAGIEPLLLEKLYNYSWNGNIRELKNIIRRGCLLATNKITAANLSKDFLSKISYDNNKNKFDKNSSEGRLNITDDLKFKSLAAEYEEIMKILKEENFNKTKAAERLKVNRKTLYNKLKTYEVLYNQPTKKNKKNKPQQ